MMDNHKIEAIIFDLGRVLVDFDHTIAAGKISRLCDKGIDEIFSLFFDSGLISLFEEGKITPQDFFLKVKEMLGLKLAYHDFVPIWNEIFFLSRENYAVYNLAKSLKRDYKLAMITNVNILHFEYLKKDFPVFDAFHHIFTSFELGTAKPAPLIYQKALSVLETKASSVFYTDDRPELIESAKALGLRAFVFRGVEQLKQDLIGSGVKIN